MKSLCKIAIPVTLQSMLQASFSIVDQIMIGQLGETNISAVGLCGNFSLIFSVVIGAVSTVAGILIAQFIGAEDTKEAWSSFDVSLISGMVIATLFLFAAGVFPSQILGLYTRDVSIVNTGAVYFRIVAFSYIPMAAGNILSSWLRCKEHATIPFWAGFGAVAVNTGLNYLLIFGKFGLEPYGMLRTTPWETIAQACINAIREVDTETMLVISGNEYSSASRWKEVSDGLKNLVDPCDNMIFQAHVYFDWDASGNYSRSYDEDGATIQTGVARLRPFVEWLKENGKRGFVGEYGVPDDDGRWLDILDSALKYLQENGVNGTYWSAGPRWGDYKLAVQPTDNYTVDRPQLATLLKYKTTVQVY